MLIKCFGLAALAMIATASSAFADFSGARCEGPKFEAFMAARIGHGVFIANGRANPNAINYGPILAASTLSNTGKTIACEVTVSIGGRPGPHPVHGRFTAMISPKGGVDWKWLPGY